MLWYKRTNLSLSQCSIKVYQVNKAKIPLLNWHRLYHSCVKFCKNKVRALNINSTTTSTSYLFQSLKIYFKQVPIIITIVIIIEWTLNGLFFYRFFFTKKLVLFIPVHVHFSMISKKVKSTKFSHFQTTSFHLTKKCKYKNTYKLTIMRP